jgi:hypothetical protein
MGREVQSNCVWVFCLTDGTVCTLVGTPQEDHMFIIYVHLMEYPPYNIFKTPAVSHDAIVKRNPRRDPVVTQLLNRLPSDIFEKLSTM